MKHSNNTLSHLSPVGAGTEPWHLNLEAGCSTMQQAGMHSLFERKSLSLGQKRLFYVNDIIMKVGHAAVKTAYNVRKSLFYRQEIILFIHQQYVLVPNLVTKQV